MSGKSVFFINNYTWFWGYKILIISIRYPTIRFDLINKLKMSIYGFVDYRWHPYTNGWRMVDWWPTKVPRVCHWSVVRPWASTHFSHRSSGRTVAYPLFNVSRMSYKNVESILINFHNSFLDSLDYCHFFCHIFMLHRDLSQLLVVEETAKITA